MCRTLSYHFRKTIMKKILTQLAAASAWLGCMLVVAKMLPHAAALA
jgi:hypothetical protein